MWLGPIHIFEGGVLTCEIVEPGLRAVHLGQLISCIEHGAVKYCPVVGMGDEIEVHLRPQPNIGAEIGLEGETFPIGEAHAQSAKPLIESQEISTEFGGTPATRL